MVARHSNKEVMRTYKVGLRVPESLLEKQNELVMELEVLHHFHETIKGKEISNLLAVKIPSCSGKTKETYQAFLEKHGSLKSLFEVDQEITRVRKALNQLHLKNKTLNSYHFSKSMLPSFKKLDSPSPDEISLTDYQNLTKKSLKLLCKHLNDRILHEIERVPRVKRKFIDLAFQISQDEGRKYTLDHIRNKFEIALSNITGIHSNIGRTAFYQLGMALKVYFELREKVSMFQSFLNPDLPSATDFSRKIPELLFYYSPPNNVRKYLAKAWDVEREWVRNTWVGWRRKIDPLLPREFQVEPLTGIFTQIATSFKEVVHGEEEMRIISKLQEKHVLHLLPLKEVDLRPLLEKSLHSHYESLQEKVARISLPGQISSHLHEISIQEFLESAGELIEQVKEVQEKLEPTSQSHENCQTFINRIKYLQAHVNDDTHEKLLGNLLIGNRFTSSILRLFSTGYEYRKLFTAARGIISLTLARKHPLAIGHFLSVFNPDTCLTFPFTSNHRNKTYLPINLIFNKFIVERKLHPSDKTFLINKSHATKPNITDTFRKGTHVWFGLPIYSPSQAKEFQEIVTGQRTRSNRKGMFWFRVIPSKKIINCLRRGAEVRDIRLNIPQGPAQRIIVDFILSAPDRTAFCHEGKFLEAWDEELGSPTIPSHDILGVDFNRIGKFMVATANPEEEHDIKEVMAFYEKMHLKLETIRTREIPRIQAQLSTGKNASGVSLSTKKKGRLSSQLSLLHRRQEKIMKEMKRQALMVYLYVGWKTRAKYYGWDSIKGISTRGTNGMLAQAITYLPKRKALYKEFCQWASDLRDQGLLPAFKDVIPVSPFTSQTCASCFQQTGRRTRSRMKGIPYHEFACKECNRSTRKDSKVHRHSNSARMDALLLHQHLRSHDLAPSLITITPVSSNDGIG